MNSEENEINVETSHNGILCLKNELDSFAEMKSEKCQLGGALTV